MTTQLFVLTGGRGSGKTTLCRQLAELKIREGWRVTGLLSPARLEGKEKSGIEALDIRTGESRLLASRKSGELSGFRFSEWDFDPAVLAWGNQVLDRSVPTELLIVDEIGPLEFNLATGWMRAFDVLAQNQYRTALVVVRPECLQDAQNRLGSIKIFDVDSRNGSLLEMILRKLQKW